MKWIVRGTVKELLAVEFKKIHKKINKVEKQVKKIKHEQITKADLENFVEELKGVFK